MNPRRCEERRKHSLPFRTVAFGHKGSRSDSVVRTGQTGEVWIRAGSVRESPFGLLQRREALSNRQAARERLRRLSPQVSNQNGSDGDATCGRCGSLRRAEQ